MTDEPLSTVAPLRNVAALTQLVDRIKNRSMNLPGMGTFYGPSGLGKSFAGTYATNKFGAVTVQMKSVWTKKTLTDAILHEMGLPPARSISDAVDQISQRLAVSDQPLIIDEADYLVKRNQIEIVRDIYEGSGAAIILIGEELLPQKLCAWERVHGRMLAWVPAQPADIADVGHLARVYARGLAIDAGLRQRILAASQGSIRRICVNLDQVREHAVRKGLKAVDQTAWGNRALFSGSAPIARKFEDRRAG